MAGSYRDPGVVLLMDPKPMVGGSFRLPGREMTEPRYPRERTAEELGLLDGCRVALIVDMPVEYQVNKNFQVGKKEYFDSTVKRLFLHQ